MQPSSSLDTGRPGAVGANHRIDGRLLQRGLPWVVVLGTVAWFYGHTLGHGFLSDDYLTVYYLDRETGNVLWGRVFEEFARPWFGSKNLYRPLVSLSTGVNLALGPGALTWHAFNVGCLAVTALATAGTARILAPARPLVAALIAGLAVALHSAAIEPSTWIAARTTGMQGAAMALAVWCFSRRLAHGGSLIPALAWGAAALLCKEGALMLPVTVLAVSVLHEPGGRWSGHLRRALPFALLVGIYLLFRVTVIGPFGSNTGWQGLTSLHNILLRFGHLTTPPHVDGPVWWPLIPLAIVLACLLRLRAGMAVLALGWWTLLLLPTHHVAADSSTLIGRLVFDAVPPLAIVLAWTASRASARLGPIVLVAVAAWLTALVPATQSWLAKVDAEDRLGRAAVEQLQAAGAAATDRQPVAVAWFPGLPIFHRKLWAVPAMRPYADRDLPVLALPNLLAHEAFAAKFVGDAAPLHAVHAEGGKVVTLNERTGALATLPPPKTGSMLLRPSPKAPDEFLVTGPWLGTALAAVEVTVPHTAQQVELELLQDLDQNPRYSACAYGRRSKRVVDGVAWFTTVHALSPVLFQSLGMPFTGLRVTVDGAPPPEDVEVRIHATLPRRPLEHPVAGGSRTRDQLAALTQAPPFDGPSRFYLVLATGVRHMDVPAGGASMSMPLRRHMDWVLDLFAPQTIRWFWASTPDTSTAPWCSSIDWANSE